eukprot:4236016-Prymnesium_polylepis.1
MKLGTRGVSILFSSGDDGAPSYLVRSSHGGQCGYEPQFPASSPYATAVGATVESQLRCERDALKRGPSARQGQ